MACTELIPVTVFIDFVICVVSPGFPHRQRAVGVLPRRRVPSGAAAVRLGQRLSGLSDDGSLSAVHPLQRGATLCQGAHAAGLFSHLNIVYPVFNYSNKLCCRNNNAEMYLDDC